MAGRVRDAGGDQRRGPALATGGSSALSAWPEAAACEGLFGYPHGYAGQITTLLFLYRAIKKGG